MTIVSVSEKRRLSQIVQESLKGGAEIRPFPAAVTQLLAACQDSNSTAATFEKIIECDPGLSVRLLRIANSPLYALSQEVRSVAHATSLLGNRQLRSLALSVAGRSVFSQGDTAQQERLDLWLHSLGCAIVARELSVYDNSVEPDDAFLAGVFHDAGKLFLFDVVPDDYVALRSEFTGRDLVDEEQAYFGTDHQEIGFKAAHGWGLPEVVKAGIGFHHVPLDTPIHPRHAMLIHMANRLANGWGLGSPAEDDEQIRTETADWLDVDVSQVEAVQESAREAFEQMRDWS